MTSQGYLSLLLCHKDVSLFVFTVYISERKCCSWCSTRSLIKRELMKHYHNSLMHVMKVA